MLACGADVLILDEPTAVLTPQESDELGTVLRRLAGAGRSIVFISHKIREILELADRATVLRRGQTVGTLSGSECSPERLSAMMFGEGLSTRTPRPERSSELHGSALEARDLSVISDRGLPAVRELSLDVRRGEIVGVAGIAGNGQVELAEALAGLRRPTAGTVSVGGTPLTGQPPRAFTRAGVAYIPEDRMSMGLSGSEPIWRNAIVKRYDREPVAWGPFVRRRAAKEVAGELTANVRLSTSDVGTPVHQLSGGNAQKLLVGRELEVGRHAVIAVNPTQGLDISAVAQVWEMLLDARESGVGTLLISSELDEVLQLSDRVLVLFEGRFVGEFDGSDASREQIGLLMAGHGVTNGAAHG
jgi:simple sugar transport system ATP-binding protein